MNQAAANTSAVMPSLPWWKQAMMSSLRFPSCVKTTRKLYVFGHFEYYDSSVHNTTAKWTNHKIVAAGINYFPLPQICVKAEYNQRIFHSKYNNEPAVNIGIAYQGFFL